MNFHVVIPHYRAHHWLDACLTLLHGHSGEPIAVTVVDMSDTPEDQERTRKLCAGGIATIVPLNVGNQVGGQPLPQALLTGTNARTDCKYTVTCDPDALIVRDDWTGELHRIFSYDKIIAAGINPRSYAHDFAGQCEWNWMAFRTDWWREHVGDFHWRRVDIGHRFRDKANEVGKDVYTWPFVEHPYPGKPGAFVGDGKGLWAYHAFYSTRKHRDVFPDAERVGILTDAQEQDIIRLCLKV
jgi:hypothetical protein